MKDVIVPVHIAALQSLVAVPQLYYASRAQEFPQGCMDPDLRRLSQEAAEGVLLCVGANIDGELSMADPQLFSQS